LARVIPFFLLMGPPLRRFVCSDRPMRPDTKTWRPDLWRARKRTRAKTKSS